MIIDSTMIYPFVRLKKQNEYWQIKVLTIREIC